MRALRRTVYLAALMLGTAAVGVAPAASASAATGHVVRPMTAPYWYYATGYGSTLNIAEQLAMYRLENGCTGDTSNGPIEIISQGQQASGTWASYERTWCS